MFFAGGPLPPEPTVQERKAAAEAVAVGNAEEVALLRELYGEELDLIAYALRDSDGDGIHDFRVSDYYGRFLEGDIDLDGDGLRNVVDAAPYDAGEGERDVNANGVPDGVDWALQGRSSAEARRQRVLLVDHGVLLVDRAASFTDALSRSVYDVITRVLAPVPGGRLPALRVVAADETCLLSPELDDGTEAMMIPQTQTLAVYRVGIDHAPFVQLGLLAHELAHGFQLSLDFEGPDLESRKIYSPAPVFLERMARFGWSSEALRPEEIPEPFALFTPHYLGAEPSYRYRGETPARWAEQLESLYAERGGDYLEAPELTELGIVGDYSLENPWEWHSDNLIAYLFTEIEARLRADAAAGLVEAARSASREAWPSFRYRNLSPEVRQHFRDVLPLRREDLAHLLDVYVHPLAPTD